MSLFDSPLDEIFVIHSRESYQELGACSEWRDKLQKCDISPEQITERVLDFDSSTKAVERFVNYFGLIIAGNDQNQNVIVDLTNGSSTGKNLLSTAAYVLDLKYQFVIDNSILRELTSKEPHRLKFVDPEYLAQAYIPVPNGTILDGIAHLNLSEVVRYKRIISSHTSAYRAVNETAADPEFFADNLKHSVRLKLQGDRTQDSAVYRIASSSISTSIEDLIRLLLEAHTSDYSPGRKQLTFGQSLQRLRHHIEGLGLTEIDVDFLRRFNDFMLYLRNSATHKAPLLTRLEKFRAELSVKMSFPFLEFYTDVVHPALSAATLAHKPKRISRIDPMNVGSSSTFYFGLDGDDTGSILEELFVSTGDEKKFKQLSRKVDEAIQSVARLVKGRLGKASIVFASGDDMLFKGELDYSFLEHLQHTYQKVAGGPTCSIGYGSSFQEVYLALKLAKTQPGKSAIVGISLKP